MAFRFPLQAVLRYRLSYERRERLQLQVIIRELLKARQLWETAKKERVSALEDLRGKLAHGLCGGELQFELACDRARVRRIAALKEQVGKLAEARTRQLGLFRKAQQRRKVLENLRERRFAAYRLDRDRRTQQQLDERFLILHAGHAPT